MNGCDDDCQGELNIPLPLTGNLRWWGYKRIDGMLVLRGFDGDYLPLHNMLKEEKIVMVYWPFSSQNQSTAQKQLQFLDRGG